MTREVTGIIVVDHGSRREDSNQMLLKLVDEFAAGSEWSIVEPAHMELAEPDIATAYHRCVERGATRIVVFPYFLLPGRHWQEDIPRLTRAAADSHPGTKWLVTAPFGLHPGMREIITDRIHSCMERARSSTDSDRQTPCDVCSPDGHCEFRNAASL